MVRRRERGKRGGQQVVVPGQRKGPEGRKANRFLEGGVVRENLQGERGILKKMHKALYGRLIEGAPVEKLWRSGVRQEFVAEKGQRRKEGKLAMRGGASQERVTTPSAHPGGRCQHLGSHDYGRRESRGATEEGREAQGRRKLLDPIQ